ncbi:MAG: hypothetical protein WKF35_00350 [Ferruginibacter sp.]
MLDNLMNLIKGNSTEAVINNPAIPNDKNNAAVEAAGTSILGTLKNSLSNGKIGEVLAYFKKHGIGGGDSDNIVKEATADYSKNLQKDLNLNAAEANSIAEKVVPASMNELATKTVDPSDKSFNIQDIFSKLSGGKSDKINFQDMLNRFDGGKLDHDGDGKVDIQDVKSMFAGEGGVVDKIKGFLK